MSTSSSSSAEPDTESGTESTSSSSTSASESESTSDSDGSLDGLQAHVRELGQATQSVQPKPQPYVYLSANMMFPLVTFIARSHFVPPGYGKAQTRSRNLRRRLRRMHEREGAGVSGGPVSGANAVVPGEDAAAQGITPDASQDTVPGLLSLSLRNKNKAKNFRALMGRPLAPKIIFGDQEGDTMAALPRLIPPSSRASLPPNLFVTSVDVEAGLHREGTKRKMRIEYGETESEGHAEPGSEAEMERLEGVANQHWATLERLTREHIVAGSIVGYKVWNVVGVSAELLIYDWTRLWASTQRRAPPGRCLRWGVWSRARGRLWSCDRCAGRG